MTQVEIFGLEKRNKHHDRRIQIILPIGRPDSNFSKTEFLYFKQRTSQPRKEPFFPSVRLTARRIDRCGSSPSQPRR